MPDCQPTESKPPARASASADRAALSPAQRDAAAAAITATLLTLTEINAARTVAAYVSFGTEPSTVHLLEALASRNIRVLLPVLRPDLDLDWAVYAPGSELIDGPRGVRHPAGPTLGVDAIGAADAVVVPALAVDRVGRRLGRGGGSYDRALARVPPGRPVIALLFVGEVVPVLPAEPHDRPVTLAVTPSTIWRF